MGVVLLNDIIGQIWVVVKRRLFLLSTTYYLFSIFYTFIQKFFLNIVFVTI